MADQRVDHQQVGADHRGREAIGGALGPAVELGVFAVAREEAQATAYGREQQAQENQHAAEGRHRPTPEHGVGSTAVDVGREGRGSKGRADQRSEDSVKHDLSVCAWGER